MEYSPQTSAIAVRLAQEAMNEIDMLEWTTIACTFIDVDNLQLVITHPNMKKPIVLGFAGFMNVPPYKAEMMMRGKIAGALIDMVKERDNAS